MRPVPEQQSRPSPVLVCAVPEPGGEPRVVLADGSYESGGERVYWRRTPDAEVLRLPLDATVALRPVRRFPDQRPPQSGEERLLAALAAHRPATPAPVVEDAGLEPLRVTSFVSVLLPAMALARLRARRAGDRFDPWRELSLGRGLDAACERTMRAELRLIARGVSLPAGGSLLVVARRAGPSGS